MHASSIARSSSCAKPFGAHRRTAPCVRPGARSMALAATTFKVEIVHEGKTHMLEVPAGESVLSVALEKGLHLPHDCKLGVCMTCPAKMISGTIDQSGAMMSEDIAAKGYALLCVAQPTSNCKIMTISEDELLDQQFGM